MKALIVKRLSPLLIMGMISVSNAQEAKTLHHQDQFWWSINSSTRITEHFGLITDFHIRRTQFISESNFYFARLGGAFWISDQLTLVGGAAHLWLAKSFDNDLTRYQNENRIYQQIQWRQKVGRVTFVQRIRNEQRWHEVLGEEGEVLRTRFSNRVRFLSSFNIKVFENPKMPSISLADEAHFHVGKEIVYNTFDQNRIFAGIKVPLRNNLSFDMGYMLLYQQHYSGNTYDVNHTFRWFFYYSPDLRSRKGKLHYAIPGDE
jgi:uncharacterized protein YqfB (UPF0267 family)